MVKTMALLLFIFVATLFSTTTVVSAQEFTPPELHAEFVIQLEKYDGGDSVVYFGRIKDAKNAIVLRHVCVEVIGKLGDYIEYNTEIGIATCQGSNLGLMLMEAGVFYKPCNFLKIGFMQGHILRGFTLYEGCIKQIPAEKPRFCKVIAQCHPTGAVIETDYDLDETMGITAQFAYLNGPKGTIDKEHDINYGLIFRTPLSGLSVGGFYNDQNWESYDNNEQNIMLYEGYRIGCGFNYDGEEVHLRAEYYHGKGFGGGPEDSVKMDAALIEAAYTFNLAQEKLSYIQPYVAFQWWDMGSNLGGYYKEGDSTHHPKGQQNYGSQASLEYVGSDYECSYLAFGICVGLGSSNAKLRIEYEMPLSFANDEYGQILKEDDEANRLIVRLQAGI